ncbi:NADH-quinone oxidoreductase subunit NuoI [Geoalkalibacter halelectricus]|uniref:NADH-quinone oxidoreductase subunit I n=1 Tax=Geoalkalibacter halelectricus TaxID=2847045 RepID=A0ABY5ZQ38_9BACT|nr:NADH-quinone oxidoreductase subunit NuoI [Geoalkalibacter halelectricus]MDO3378690.1 NADH-quinone oxidoreductase subunit NuoI [Geoalkalibacter halelectricus]UWZ80000.1 NADH-quinone oxidoreductase subunit NuoI [Geoalkalibacter halelectricus]
MTLFRDIKGTVQPFWITLRTMLRKPVTVQYPEEQRPPAERARARMILTRDPDGGERCVACHLCSAACPVDCISMQAAEAPDGRRYAAWFRINFARCIFCGLCAEACPTLAIQMSPEFAFCKDDPLDLVYEKQDLLVDHGGKNRDYNFYRHAGIGVVNPRGGNDDEYGPVDVKSNLP